MKSHEPIEQVPIQLSETEQSRYIVTRYKTPYLPSLLSITPLFSAYLTFPNNYTLGNFHSGSECRRDLEDRWGGFTFCLSMAQFITVYITLLQWYFTLVACSIHTVGYKYWAAAEMSSLLIWYRCVKVTLLFSRSHKLSRCGIRVRLFSVFMDFILSILYHTVKDAEIMDQWSSFELWLLHYYHKRNYCLNPLVNRVWMAGSGSYLTHLWK